MDVCLSGHRQCRRHGRVLPQNRDTPAARRFLRKALKRQDQPDRIVIRKSKYLNNRIERDHRRVKRRIRSMLGFKSAASAEIILSDIEMVHMMHKQQARFAYNPRPSLAEQFENHRSLNRCARGSLVRPRFRFATDPFEHGKLPQISEGFCPTQVAIPFATEPACWLCL